MPRLSRKLRICQWAGTVGCVLILAAFVGSGWRTLGYQRPTRSHVFLFELGSGDISVALAPWDTSVPQGWDLMATSRPIWARFRFTLLPWFGRWDVSWRAGGWFLIFPLWLLYVLLLIPTLLLWRRERKPRPGRCRRCDYDLTGNVSGICPECGLEIPKPPTLSEPAPHE